MDASATKIFIEGLTTIVIIVGLFFIFHRIIIEWFQHSQSKAWDAYAKAKDEIRDLEDEIETLLGFGHATSAPADQVTQASLGTAAPTVTAPAAPVAPTPSA